MESEFGCLINWLMMMICLNSVCRNVSPTVVSMWIINVGLWRYGENGCATLMIHWDVGFDDVSNINDMIWCTNKRIQVGLHWYKTAPVTITQDISGCRAAISPSILSRVQGGIRCWSSWFLDPNKPSKPSKPVKSPGRKVASVFSPFSSSGWRWGVLQWQGDNRDNV